MSVDLGVQAAGAWRLCSYQVIIEGIELVCINGLVSMNGQMHSPHDVCNGTGRIYALPDTVRVPCPFGHTAKDALCGNCASRRWTASTDYLTWRDAAKTLWTIKIISAWMILYTEVGSPTNRVAGDDLPALQSAIAQALVADGWTLTGEPV